MKHSVLLSFIFLFLSSPSILPAQSSGELTVARINGEPVSDRYFTKSYIHHLRTSGLNDTREERYLHLESIINELLLVQQLGAFSLNDEEMMAYQERVNKKLRADVFYNRAFLDTLSPPTESDIRGGYFKSHIKLYASQLFFTDSLEAHRRYNQLNSGEDFIHLANEVYNLAEFDSLAGYLGEMSYFGVAPEVSEAAFNLKAGEYSSPVRTRFGYHIIKIEERVANPLVTEAEFRRRYDGVNSQEKQRIMAQMGDRFVRNFMQTLNITLNLENIEQLFYAIQEIDSKQNPSAIELGTPKNYATSQDVEFVKQNFDASTVLATYSFKGEEFEFTAGDYYFWFSFIPLSEAKSRTNASVGRALRNEVFSLAALSMNLENDELFQFELNYHMDNYKSWRVKRYLVDQEPVPIPDEVLERAVQSSDINRIEEVRFTGWVIKTENLESAREIKKTIEETGRTPDSFDGYYFYQNEDVRSAYDLRTHIFRALPNYLTIAGTRDSYYLMFVEDRKIEQKPAEEVRQEVEKQVRQSYNITHHLNEIRKEAEIEIFTDAFESLMSHFDDPALRGMK